MKVIISGIIFKMYFVKAMAMVSILISPLIIEAESRKCYQCYSGECSSPSTLDKNNFCETDGPCLKTVERDGNRNTGRVCPEAMEKNIPNYKASAGCSKIVDNIGVVDVCGCESDYCNAGVSMYLAKTLFVVLLLTIMLNY